MRFKEVKKVMELASDRETFRDAQVRDGAVELTLWAERWVCRKPSVMRLPSRTSGASRRVDEDCHVL